MRPTGSRQDWPAFPLVALSLSAHSAGFRAHRAGVWQVLHPLAGSGAHPVGLPQGPHTFESFAPSPRFPLVGFGGHRAGLWQSLDSFGPLAPWPYDDDDVVSDAFQVVIRD